MAKGQASMGRLVSLERKTAGDGGTPARPRPPGPPRLPLRAANDNRPPWREILLRALFWAGFAALAAAWWATA